MVSRELDAEHREAIATRVSVVAVAAARPAEATASSTRYVKPQPAPYDRAFTDFTCTHVLALSSPLDFDTLHNNMHPPITRQWNAYPVWPSVSSQRQNRQCFHYSLVSLVSLLNACTGLLQAQITGYSKATN